MPSWGQEASASSAIEMPGDSPYPELTPRIALNEDLERVVGSQTIINLLCGLIKSGAFWASGFDKGLSPSPQSSPVKGEEDNRESS